MIRIALVGCAAVAALTSNSSAQIRFRTVAISGQPAPGQVPGTVIGFFGAAPGATSFNVAPVRIDEHGSLAFSAGLGAAGAIATVGAVIKEENGGLQLLARNGQPAPGGGVFNMISLFNNAPGFAGGQCSFFSTIDTLNFGTFTDRGGILRRSLFSGDHPPGTRAGATFFQLAMHMARSGALLYNARYAVGGSAQRVDEGLWRDTTGALEVVAVNDMPAPGTGPGVVFTEGTGQAFFGPIDVWNADGAGHVIFNGYLGGPGITVNNDEGIWIEGAAGLSLLVREGDAAPGAGAGARFANSGGFHTFGGIDEGLSGMGLNTAGNAVFSAILSVPGAGNPTSIWARLGGALVLLAREGLQAPGFPQEITYADFFPRLVLTESSRIALNGSAMDAAQETRSAIWTGQGGQLSLLVRQGQARPSGGMFGQLVLFQYSESGVAVFEDLSDASFYSADASGHIDRILGPGDPYQVAAGDTRVVRQVGPGLGIGDAGEFGFTLEFTDLSQAIVVVTPPAACYPNCDGSTSAPTLNVLDFGCFLNRFANGDSYANCDGSTAPPVLNIADFTCFLNRFATGCP